MLNASSYLARRPPVTRTCQSSLTCKCLGGIVHILYMSFSIIQHQTMMDNGCSRRKLALLRSNRRYIGVGKTVRYGMAREGTIPARKVGKKRTLEKRAWTHGCVATGPCNRSSPTSDSRSRGMTICAMPSARDRQARFAFQCPN